MIKTNLLSNSAQYVVFIFGENTNAQDRFNPKVLKCERTNNQIPLLSTVCVLSRHICFAE